MTMRRIGNRAFASLFMCLALALLLGAGAARAAPRRSSTERC